MKKEPQIYNLASLLRLNNINISGIAENNPSMTVGECFDSLSELTDSEKSLIDAISTPSADKDITVHAADLLTSLGSDRMVGALKNVLESGSAADSVSFAVDFTALCGRIRHAIISSKPNYTTPLQNIPSRTAKLKTVISRMAQEDATRKLRVLAVDDAAVMLHTITAALSDTYKVITLSKPTMLETLLRQVTPELFLLDYKMPDLSGFDLIPVIRSFEEHRDTPIVILTAIGTIDNISSAVALGACDFIVKPFEPRILRERIARHIVRKPLF